MDPELLKLVQEVVEKGLTSRIWVIMLLGLICAGAGAFFGSYLKKRGEQRAINEKFQEVLKQIEAQTEATEAIKAEFAKEISSFTENLKANFSTDLERLKATLQEDLSYKTEILLPRLEAYKTLWVLTYIVRRTGKDRIKDEEKVKLEEDLTSWYYNNGHGIFLSLESGRLWRNARRSLSGDSDEDIKKAFSDLKTQLKAEIKVYGEMDVATELGT